MGPSIIFDKSAIQSIGQRAIYEVNRYFYTVLPPVLLMEILADLSLDPEDLEGSKVKVAEVARKVLPPDSFANLDYRSLCIADLLGGEIEMSRRPVVGGARAVVSKDGRQGVHIDVQPENEAVLRWRAGEFNEDDLQFADSWRRNAQAIDLEAIKKGLPKSPIKFRSVKELAIFVDTMLEETDLQAAMLDWLLDLLRYERYVCNWVRHRWHVHGYTSIKAFAPYAFHCLRVQTLFLLGMSHNLLGTRPTNVLDVEYFFYSPFAHAFCSGDKIHRQLAPIVLEDDQTFVPREEMRKALMELVTARQEIRDVEPRDESIIHRLWTKHLERSVPQASRPPISQARSKRTMEQIKPIMEAIRESELRRPPPPRWPA
ncbi:MAG: hypothetical protein WDZ31_01065 [Phycisphaeraceae bacterium]